MPTVRIWSLEPDYDAEAIKRLADELLTHLRIGNLSIKASDRNALPRRTRNREASSNTLRKALQHYLEQDDCVIFVTNQNGSILEYEPQEEANSRINQIEAIINDSSLTGRVFFTRATQELEASLREVLSAIADVNRAARTDFAEVQFRKLSASRGLDWDKMTDEDRIAFVDDLIHEDRGFNPVNPDSDRMQR